jgi:hypothetical protein
MNEKIEQWIPWYVNGTLGAAERAEMDRYLHVDDEARAEVALFARASQAIKASVDHVPADIGLNKALSRIRAEKTSTIVNVGSDAKRSSLSSPSLMQRIGNWLGASWTQPALALALMVIGVQSFMLFGSGKDEMQMRGSTVGAEKKGNASAAADLAYFRVIFKPTATEGDIRVLLGGSAANFVSGPGESGEYTISVASKDAVRVLDIFKKSNVVARANPSAAPTATNQ